MKAWSAQQLVSLYQQLGDRDKHISQTIGFVLDKPEVMKLWIEDLLAPGDIRHRYPEWDQLVEVVGSRLNQVAIDEEVDAEVFCVMLLTAIFALPRAFSSILFSPAPATRPSLPDLPRNFNTCMLTREGFYPEVTAAG